MRSILAEGLPEFEAFLERAPGIARRAARLAINQTVSRKGVSLVQAAIREEVDFPAGYLEQRMSVQQATDNNLQAAIIGRHTPTSLARFAVSGSPSVPKAGVSVRVNPGHTSMFSHAFLLRLRGAPDSYNIGLAVRLKKGETIHNKNVMVKSFSSKDSSLYLLYGPSVDQVFRDVAVRVGPGLLDLAGTEFIRQFTRLI